MPSTHAVRPSLSLYRLLFARWEVKQTGLQTGTNLCMYVTEFTAKMSRELSLAVLWLFTPEERWGGWEEPSQLINNARTWPEYQQLHASQPASQESTNLSVKCDNSSLPVKFHCSPIWTQLCALRCHSLTQLQTFIVMISRYFYSNVFRLIRSYWLCFL